ncbi:hypothetical protein [Paraburkholderia silvatlantica]|uniref:hypothetical protein n=1 Tax=Paraburkholderia silvatlantica TaxID=321895 RepID=UPI003751CB83
MSATPGQHLPVPVIEPFMQAMLLMFGAELIDPTELRIAEVLIEAKRLKTDRIEGGVLAAAQTCFVFCGVH